jgi:aspartyl-tRNA(Asn)/glutamyl-tRNA(Gln) amidotransferase subunit A
MPRDERLAFASLRELGSKLRAGEFTSVQLTEFFLDRLRTWGPRLNAVVTLTGELALAQAKAADEDLQSGRDRGPLHGIPYGAKDLLATKGLPTTWGAAPFKDQVFHQDATVIRKLQDAGAVLVAKLAMVEIAGGLGYDQANASFTGPGLNPWDTARWSGGSSSGSGSAVGGGLVPWAIGTETWGSIMTPAGYCGVTGLRPTYGRVSRHGAMALSWTMDKIGCLTRTADDAGCVLAAIAGPDPLDPSAVDLPFEYPSRAVPPARWRLARIKGDVADVQSEVKANFEQSLEVLRRFAEIGEIELPDLPYGAVAGTLIDCELAAAFEGILVSGRVWEMTAPEDRVGAHAAQFIPAKDYINAQRIRRHIQKALDELLTPLDAIVTPTLASVAGPIAVPFAAYHRRYKSTNIGGAENAAGIPAITLPNGLGEGGLPTGLKLVGRAFEEGKLIEIAKAYQAATDFHKQAPVLAKG